VVLGFLPLPDGSRVEVFVSAEGVRYHGSSAASGQGGGGGGGGGFSPRRLNAFQHFPGWSALELDTAAEAVRAQGSFSEAEFRKGRLRIQ
jgi:hypothetical protein